MNNDFQNQLWADLMSLCGGDKDVFYFGDFVLNPTGKVVHKYRIFNYRLASYTEFLRSNAINCRGTMFELDPETDEPIALVSLPMHKFFNLNENPITMDLPLNDIRMIMDKADGSLISTYFVREGDDTPFVRCKSKGSVSSTQALAASRMIQDDRAFYAELYALSHLCITVNMEYVAPDNQIVLGYDKPELIVLNARSTVTGEYYWDIFNPEKWPECAKRAIKRYETNDPKALVGAVVDLQGQEGYVVITDTVWFKAKSSWYMSLHHVKDSINNPRRLWEAVVNETADDLRALFVQDPLSLQKIADMEEHVHVAFHNLRVTVDGFYDEHKDLPRKDYAIAGQAALKNKGYFGLAMSKYLGQEVNYKEFLIKNYKIYGIRDEVPNE